MVRLSGAEDILGVLPHRLGFHPTESLVVVFLDGPRQRDRLVMRVDLVDERHEGALAADVARRMRTMRTSAAVLVCYTERPSTDHRLPRAGLIRALTRLLSKRGVGVLEALLVHGGRWYSYHCTDPRCCPRSGSRLPAELTPAASRYAAEAVLRGGTVLPSREVLRLSVEPPVDASVREGAVVAHGADPTDAAPGAAVVRLADVEHARAAAPASAARLDGSPSSTAASAARRRQLVVEAAGRLMAVVREAGIEAWRDVVLATVDRLVAAWCDGETEIEDDDAALVALGLHDTRTRDEVMTLPLDHEPAVLVALFSEIARRTDDVTAEPNGDVVD